MFEEFGFNYIGPIDGHDVDVLVDTLSNIRSLKGPQFLHIVTKKGHGYKLAESDPVKYHGVTKFDPSNGLASGKGGGKPQYTQVFGDWICDMAKRDPRLIGITPAMREGSGLVRFEQEHPTVITMWPSPSSTRSPSPPAWPVTAPNRWWRSTPPSCSAHTIN